MVTLPLQEDGGAREQGTANRPDGSSQIEPVPSTDLVREVAGQLKSLGKSLPYDEYAAVVLQVARLRARLTTEGAELRVSTTRHEMR